MRRTTTLTRKLLTAQVCRACGETIYGGDPAYRYVIRGRTHYHHAGVDPCRPLPFELEDDPDIAKEMQSLPSAQRAVNTRKLQLANIRATREAEQAGKSQAEIRMDTIHRIRSRYPHAREDT